jgi:hypothetical protein
MELDHLPYCINRQEVLGPGRNPFPVLMDMPNTWKHDLEEKLASKIRKYWHE